MAIGDFMGMMKQARALQARMAEIQSEIAALEVEGTAGGGLVRVVMSGKGEMKRLAIDPSLVKPDEREILEDLVVAAANDARGKAEAALAEKMRSAAGGLDLPPGLIPGG
jgi:DNA-binding YbaB/EbfC family protein